MILKFEEWLTNQQYREDLVGDLAREPKIQDIKYKTSRGRSDEHRNWADFVTGMADTGYVTVFNEAWQEFLLAKQVAQDSLDSL